MNKDQIKVVSGRSVFFVLIGMFLLNFFVIHGPGIELILILVLSLLFIDLIYYALKKSWMPRRIFVRFCALCFIVYILYIILSIWIWSDIYNHGF